MDTSSQEAIQPYILTTFPYAYYPTYCPSTGYGCHIGVGVSFVQEQDVVISPSLPDYSMRDQPIGFFENNDVPKADPLRRYPLGQNLISYLH